MKVKVIVFGLCYAAAMAAAGAAANRQPETGEAVDAIAIPRMLGYQGRLTDSAGRLGA